MTPSFPRRPDRSFRSALIVDDHPLFCDALAMTLKAISPFDDIATVACLQEALDRIAEAGPPDFVVLDLNLPDVNGLEGLIRLRRMTEAPVLVVSSLADNRIITLVIRAGASGFVPKHSRREVFAEAITALDRGEQFIPPGYTLLEEAAGGDRSEAMERLASLTQQQSRILQLICEGKLNKQIAYELSIAETTVKAHVTAIMRKLGVQSRTQAVLLANEASFATVLQEAGHQP